MFYYYFAIDGLNLLRQCTWYFNIPGKLNKKNEKTVGVILNDSFLRGNLISALAMNQWNLKGNILLILLHFLSTPMLIMLFNTTCAVM